MNNFKKSLPTALLAAALWMSSALAADVEVPYTEYTLDNGLRLIVHEDHKAPIVAVNIWYHVGSKNEKPGKTGFAHLFEHLMFNGTENYNDEYFGPFEKVGATGMNGTTWFDRTNYFQNVPSTALDLALWMESDRMGHLLGAVTQDRLDEQRGVVQNEKRQGDNQPYGRVYEELQKNLFSSDHPYSWETIGSMEDLDAASLEDVIEWFKTYYGPNNAVLVVAGDVTPEVALEKVEKYFGDIPPGPPISKFDVWAPKLQQDARATMQDRVPQARIYKTWVGPNWAARDADLLELAGAVLSSGKTSRLYKRLVYDEQIATSVDAMPQAFEIAGLLGIDATVQPGGDIGVVEKAIDEELARFLDKGPTQEELDRVRTQMRARMIRGLEQIGGFGGKAQMLARNATYAGDPGFYKTQMQRIDEATPEDVRDAARRWFTAGSFTLEVVPFPEVSASAEGADRSSGPPMPDTFPEVDFSTFERSALSNGMELIVATRKAVPVVQFSLSVDAGFASDQFTEMGTSSLAMDMLTEGTKRRSSLEISDELARLGASLGAGAGIDRSSVSLNALKSNLDASLDLYADVILNPSFPQGDLDRLKKQRLARIQQEKNQPVGMALRLMPALIYGQGHAYSVPLTGSGTEASVGRITRDKLLDYHKTWFRPNNATLVVVGDTTMAEIKPKLEKLFAKWKPADVPVKNIGKVDGLDSDRIYIVDRPDAVQSVVIGGNLAPAIVDGNEIAVETMNEILGGSFTSRVNMNLREDKHWAYGAFTILIDTKGQRPYFAFAPVQTDKTAPTMTEIKRELTEYLGSNPATEDELAKVQANNTLSLPGRWETAGAVLRDLNELVAYDLPDDYWDQYADQVRGLNLQEIKAAAKEVVQPDKLLWIVVGDRNKIEAEIRELELGEISIIDADGNPID